MLWKLSAPGEGAAEHCLMRVSQTDYLFDGRDECLDWMPNVRAAQLTYLSYVTTGP